MCQVAGKPNQKIPKAPLIPMPAFDKPFSRVIVDCVGSLPKTKSGNQYLLTIMCASTHFPEAIPLRNIKAPNIVKALTKFFTLVGLPRSLQSDQGSNFMSGLMQQVMYQLGIKQFQLAAIILSPRALLNISIKLLRKCYVHIVWNMERTGMRECTWYYLHLERLYKNPWGSVPLGYCLDVQFMGH